MSRLYLLDTNIVSHLLRQPQGVVARQIATVGEASVATSVIVAAELRYGAAKNPAFASRVEQILAAMEVLSFEPPADAFYASIRARLEADGNPIGGNDMLIAAQALALGRTVVTDNEREFRRVDGLKVENWLR